MKGKRAGAGGGKRRGPLHTSEGHIQAGRQRAAPPAKPLKQAAPVVERRGVARLDLEGAGVVRDRLLAAPEAVTAECAVVVRAAVAGVELDGARVVRDRLLKQALLNSGACNDRALGVVRLGIGGHAHYRDYLHGGGRREALDPLQEEALASNRRPAHPPAAPTCLRSEKPRLW